MIEATYSITAEEFSEAQKIWSAQNQKKLPGNQLMTAAYLMLGAGVGWNLHYLPKAAAAYLCIAFALVVGVPYWRRIAIRRYVYEQATDRHESVQLEVDEMGYSTVRPEFNECRMKWRCFTNWLEGKTVIVLGRGTQMCVIPKSALSAPQLVELREILAAHLIRK